MNKRVKLINGFPLLLLGLLASILLQNGAILVVTLLFGLIGKSLIRLLFSSYNQYISNRIFILFFTVYFCYSFITNAIFAGNPYSEFYVFKDSLHFFSEIDALLKQGYSLKQILFIIHDHRQFNEYYGFSYFSAILGSFAQIFGSNGLFLQKIQIVFFSSFLPVFIYNMGCNYWNSAVSKKLAIVYGLCSWTFFFSAIYFRDVHVAFVYLLAFFLFFKKFSISNLVLLVGLGFIASTLRPENGLFFVAILGCYLLNYYLYLNRSLEKTVLASFFFIFLIGVLIATGLVENILHTLNQTTDTYDNLSLSTANTDGIGILLLKLPIGIRTIARAIYSQLFPLPFYISYSLYDVSFWSLLAMLASIFWYFVWAIIVTGFFRRQYRKKIPNTLLVLFLVAVLLILSASSGGTDIRRYICVYPPIFLLSAYFYKLMAHRLRIRLFFSSIVLYLILIIFYLLVKI